MAVVYVHLEADTGNPFYVGIGKTEARAYNLKRRSDFHKNVAAKHGVRVEIIHDELTWDTACWWEQRWIKALRGAGYRLVNQTAGGDGMHDPTDAVRKRIAKSVSKYLLSLGDEHFSKRKEVREKRSNSLKGKPKSEKHIQNLKLALNAPNRISPNSKLDKRIKHSEKLRAKGEKHASKDPLTRAKMKEFWHTEKAMFLLWYRVNVRYQNYWGA